ncbi:hypothetical protein [Murimonas intestini]|uniref:hypothetical protein n=1 Tax=Murimonas intestini TaxID=1337051 RepID=UPI001FAA8A4C|nr:hypothetical protein [Murimonas intestini]MCR1842607.1 hypothetical protein [Murimonas intestini]MCR1867346.1 hypothetical protein [Murimonas intestini]MCR1884533.1 hypothetical protein [Murimonas intestini]
MNHRKAGCGWNWLNGLLSDTGGRPFSEGRYAPSGSSDIKGGGALLREKTIARGVREITNQDRKKGGMYYV